jgi:predicted PolB exonuclease-like 3'-5' exonuclease
MLSKSETWNAFYITFAKRSTSQNLDVRVSEPRPMVVDDFLTSICTHCGFLLGAFVPGMPCPQCGELLL